MSTIYLYVKQHNITGLKYFGKTIRNPFEYNGSGLYWQRHLKIHGKKHIKTLEVWGFDNQESCTQFAIRFSQDNDIVESKEWANIRIENGKDGGGNNTGEKNSFYGKTHSDEFKQKQSIRMKNRIVSDETKEKLKLSHIGRPKRKMPERFSVSIRKSHIGRKWWNNGIEEKFQKEPPSPDYVLGRKPK